MPELRRLLLPNFVDCRLNGNHLNGLALLNEN